MSRVFNFDVPCCSPDLGHCACGDEERILRAYSSGAALPAMTPVQREWCIKEAVSAAEGGLYESECAELSDRELATATLQAWKDYAVSQGMY